VCLLASLQVYLQHVKQEDSDDSEINTQLDQLLDLSNFYSAHFHELPNVPPLSIVPGTKQHLLFYSV